MSDAPNWDDLKPVEHSAPNWDDLKPAQQAQGPSYRDQLNQAMQAAVHALVPSWEHNKSKQLSKESFIRGDLGTGPDYSPYKAANPMFMPDDRINPVGNDAQMVAALGAAGAARALPAMGRLMAGAPSPPALPSGGSVPPANFGAMPTANTFGAQMARNVASSPVGAGTPPPLPSSGVGNIAQNALLQQVAKGALPTAAGAVGHALGIPGMHSLGHMIPKVLGFH